MEGQAEPVKDKSEAGPVRGSGEPSEVTPGKWFTDATELSPKKPVQAQIVPGETHFYRAPVEHGQQLAGKLSLVEEAKDFKESKAGDSLILTAYNERVPKSSWRVSAPPCRRIIRKTSATRRLSFSRTVTGVRIRTGPCTPRPNASEKAASSTSPSTTSSS